MTETNAGDRARLIATVEDALAADPARYSPFGLSFDPDRVSQTRFGWVVYIASNRPGVSSMDLAYVLNELTRAVEAKTGLFVVVLLDQSAAQSDAA